MTQLQEQTRPAEGIHAVFQRAVTFGGPLGTPARTCASIVRIASLFISQGEGRSVTVETPYETVDARNFLQMMNMEVGDAQVIQFNVRGPKSMALPCLDALEQAVEDTAAFR